jgi:hypothetical protein
MNETRIPGNVRRREAVGDANVWKWFRPDGRLERMPASPVDRHTVLAYIADRFERGREYGEPEVNVILAQIDRDAASLRRHLVDTGLMTRSAGRYRRT